MYLIAWILACDNRFHAVLLRQSSGREDFGEIIKIE